jgi:hypothetical protein
MRKLFKFGSVLYLIMFFGGVLVAHSLNMSVEYAGIGYVISVMCAAYLAIEYAEV